MKIVVIIRGMRRRLSPFVTPEHHKQNILLPRVHEGAALSYNDG